MKNEPIVKRGRRLSRELVERMGLHYTDTWEEEGAVKDKKYSWICTTCGGEFIFRRDAERCCNNRTREMEIADDLIYGMGLWLKRYSRDPDDSRTPPIQPKPIMFVLSLERQLRIYQREIQGFEVRGWTNKTNKYYWEMVARNAYYSEVLPMIRNAETYEDIIDILQHNGTHHPEVEGYIVESLESWDRDMELYKEDMKQISDGGVIL